MVKRLLSTSPIGSVSGRSNGRSNGAAFSFSASAGFHLHSSVRTILLLVTLLLAPLTAEAEATPELAFNLEQDEIEMGRVFIGQLQYSGKSGTGPADLSPWENAFFIERSNFSLEKKDGRLYSTEDIRLYPRYVGDLVINAIAHGGVIMEPLHVKVKPLIRNGIDGDPKLLPLPTQAQVGVPLEITVEVPLLHPSNEVVADEWEVEGTRIIPLRSEVKEEGNLKKTELRWKLYALHQGEFTLDLPATYQRGNGKWRFHLPLQTVEFFPLPSYLPPTLPVGQLKMRSEIIDTNDQPYWRIKIENSGLLGEEIYGLRTSLAKTTGASESEISITPAKATASGGEQMTYQFPVPQWTFNLWHGPKLVQQYYNPATGNVETLNHYLPAAQHLPLWAKALRDALTLLALGLMLYGLARIYRQVRKHLKFRQDVKSCNNPDALRRLLLQHDNCKTLKQWVKKTHDDHAFVIAKKLGQQCFGKGSSADLTMLKREVLRLRHWRR